MGEVLLTRIWGVPPAFLGIGSYSSGLRAGGSPQILVDKTSPMTGRLRVYRVVRGCMYFISFIKWIFHQFHYWKYQIFRHTEQRWQELQPPGGLQPEFPGFLVCGDDPSAVHPHQERGQEQQEQQGITPQGLLRLVQSEYRVSHPIVHRYFSAKMWYFATGLWASSAANYCLSGFLRRS